FVGYVTTRSPGFTQDLLHASPTPSVFPWPYTPDLGSGRLLGVLSGAPASPTALGTAWQHAPSLRDITPVLRYYKPVRHRLAVSHFPGFVGYMPDPAPPISR